jgi:tRNA/tmRNA/rRNA uracil-C5-methylase (TrmA/RlmC/RlmD family)
MTDNVLQIESMDLEAQGVAHREDGKVVFVEGALPFEAVRANIHRKKNNWEQALCLRWCMSPRNACARDARILVCMRVLAGVARCNI